jgi:dolichol-phosphate mannosyltransferase
MFYKIMSVSSGLDMSKASDFKLMDKKVVEALLNMSERNTFFRAMSSWIGFKSTSVEFDVEERRAGQSKWSPESLIRYAVNSIAAYSSLPMQMVTGAGVFSLLLTLVLGIQTIVRYFTGHAVEGFTTVILLILILGSIVMISLGIIGYYISQIYEEVKARPRYIISKRIGF